MKAMLYADWMSFKQSLKSLLFVLAVFALTGLFISGPSFFSMIIVMLSIMTPITLCSVDKAYGWDRLSLSMPILRRDVVGSKFVLSLSSSLAMLAISTVLAAVYNVLHPEEDLISNLAGLILCEAMSLILMGVILVATVKWGIEKARYVMIACVWVPILFVFLVKKVGVPMPDLSWLEALSGATLCSYAVALTAVGLIVYLICYTLAVKVYQKTEL